MDYWGEFYVTDPGDYIFSLDSDDGSKLEIDNQLLIDLDGVHQAVSYTHLDVYKRQGDDGGDVVERAAARDCEHV